MAKDKKSEKASKADAKADPAMKVLKSMNEQQVIKDIALCGIAKTEKGYALVSATVTPAGTIQDVIVGNAEAFPQFVAIQLRKLLLKNLGKL